MRAGLPVVATDVGGVREEVVEGQTGFLVPRGDVRAARDRLGLLLADPTLRERMGAAGRRRYEDMFSLDRMLKKTLEVYRDVMGDPRRTEQADGPRGSKGKGVSEE